VNSIEAITELGAPAERETFKITDLGSATWAMRKLAHIKAQEKQIHDTACAEIERIEAWDAAEHKRLDGEAMFFESHLIDYHQRLIAEDPKAKTVRLPHGQLKCRAQQPEWTKDEDKLLEWAKAADPTNLVEIKESARWAEIKKRLSVLPDGSAVDVNSGEIVPGVLALEQPPKFSVDVEVV
jgi:phage host-nuclease inhibitor protein Gam